MSHVIPLTHARQRPCVVFVDDDAGNRQAFRSAFREAMEVFTAGSAAELWRLLELYAVDVVIADQRMPSLRGSDLLAQVKERHPHVRRMLMTGYADLDAIIEAVNNGGVSGYFAKPWVHDQVVRAVDQAYTERRAEQDHVSYIRKLEDANRQLEFALRQRLLS
ncbi:MAG: response regulator [Flavobacteriales bacterium]|jgi:DNA-binding NtrC family response regulator|nr:response regulator [Flavobacteriales bacterium]